MTDSENPAAPAIEEKKPVSSAEADLTKYKVSINRNSNEEKLFTRLKYQTAADIVHQATKRLIELCVDGAKVIDLCIEGDKLIEQGTGAVYNKSVKGVKVNKGVLSLSTSSMTLIWYTNLLQGSPFLLASLSTML